MTHSELFIDLNSDVGEIPAAITDGTQESLMQYLTSVNIACGGHAGDESSMRATIQQAMRCNLAIGAHPGYPDRANFGRIAMRMASDEIANSVAKQVLSLSRIATEVGATITHVKPHGALYNEAAHNNSLAAAIADGVKRTGCNVILVGLAGSAMLDVFRDAGFRVAAEAFVDRRYEPDGTLRSRKLHNSMIDNPEEAAAQALGLVVRNTVLASDEIEIPVHAQTLCIHGDTHGADKIAAAVSKHLQDAHVVLRRLDAA